MFFCFLFFACLSIVPRLVSVDWARHVWPAFESQDRAKLAAEVEQVRVKTQVLIEKVQLTRRERTVAAAALLLGEEKLLCTEEEVAARVNKETERWRECKLTEKQLASRQLMCLYLQKELLLLWQVPNKFLPTQARSQTVGGKTKSVKYTVAEYSRLLVSLHRLKEVQAQLKTPAPSIDSLFEYDGAQHLKYRNGTVSTLLTTLTGKWKEQLQREKKDILQEAEDKNKQLQNQPHAWAKLKKEKKKARQRKTAAKNKKKQPQKKKKQGKKQGKEAKAAGKKSDDDDFVSMNMVMEEDPDLLELRPVSACPVNYAAQFREAQALEQQQQILFCFEDEGWRPGTICGPYHGPGSFNVQCVFPPDLFHGHSKETFNVGLFPANYYNPTTPTDAHQWVLMEEITCDECGSPEAENLYCCDEQGCWKAFHVDCCDRLAPDTADDWLCPACQPQALPTVVPATTPTRPKKKQKRTKRAQRK